MRGSVIYVITCRKLHEKFQKYIDLNLGVPYEGRDCWKRHILQFYPERYMSFFQRTCTDRKDFFKIQSFFSNCNELAYLAYIYRLSSYVVLTKK